MTNLEREASELIVEIESACARAADYAGSNPLDADVRDEFVGRIVALARRSMFAQSVGHQTALDDFRKQADAVSAFTRVPRTTELL